MKSYIVGSENETMVIPLPSGNLLIFSLYELGVWEYIIEESRIIVDGVTKFIFLTCQGNKF